MKEGDMLGLAGQPITEAGWYTLRFVFDSDDGSLMVEFQLLRDGETLITEPIDSTWGSGKSISSFEVSDLGSGYVWFVSIADDLALPIDEQTLVRLP